VVEVDDGACDDDIFCTQDTCSEADGCVYATDDGVCDDGIACTTDSCDSTIGCVVTPDDTLCGDSELCTTWTCSASEGCQSESEDLCCGNGVTEAGETCDDGNVDPGDGCDSACSQEAPGFCDDTQPPQFINATTNIVSNGTSLDLLTPSFVSEGDLLLVVVTTNNYNTVSSIPAGWSEVNALTSGGNCGSQVLFRVAEANESSVHSFPFSTGTYASGIMSAYSGASVTDPIAVASVTATGGYTAEPITTAANNTLLVLMTSSGNGANTWTTPAGWTQANGGGQNSTSSGAFHKIQGVSGSTGVTTAPSSVTDIGYAHLIALNHCSLCGNGQVDAGEECDDSNTNNGDGCSSACEQEQGGDDFTPGASVSGSRRVFVTSAGYSGNMGGLTGADAICQSHADGAGLGGTWRAWLSSSVEKVADRLTHPTGGYQRVDGAVVSSSWDALLTSSPAIAPELDEFGNQIPYVGAGSATGCSWASGYFFHPWTASNNQGIYEGPSCSDWNSNSGTGKVGLGGYSLTQWTNWCPGFDCAWSQPLYCFEM